MTEPIQQISHFQTDWLASDPVFYHEKTGQVSHNINDVIDFRNLELHPEGLINFLKFGYSVFEQTPVKDVKFLRHSSQLSVTDGKIQVRYHPDPAEAQVGHTTQEEQVLHQLRTSIREWEQSFSGNIIIPTSGGYDSRLLNEMIHDKSRIRAYTYGISHVQSESYEVVYAKKIAAVLGTRFQQVTLGNYHNYFQEWDALFGASTHAHGMYHMEFYDKIRQNETAGTALLSGIIGDIWAGSMAVAPIETPEDLLKLSYSHGLRANADQCLLSSKNELLHHYFEQQREKLEDPRIRIIEAMRFKIILLCYLLKVPARTGFKPWSPFLIQENALAMLNLPDERRKNRVWQGDYFKQRSLDVESLNLSNTRRNTLDRSAMYQVPLKPLDEGLLREVMQPAYLQWINKHILPSNNFRDFLDTLLYYPKIGGLLRKMGVKDEKMAAYNAYVTLKPIEALLRKRNNA